VPADRMPAMHLAARSNFVAMVQWLLECDMPATVAAANGSTPIHDAAAAGCLLGVQVRLRRLIGGLLLECEGLRSMHAVHSLTHAHTHTHTHIHKHAQTHGHTCLSPTHCLSGPHGGSACCSTMPRSRTRLWGRWG
jgi:hypothetical protein